MQRRLKGVCEAPSGGRFRDTNVVTYGHGSKYYRVYATRILETMANYASLSVMRPDLVELLRQEKPELVAELAATVKEILKKAGEEQ